MRSNYDDSGAEEAQANAEGAIYKAGVRQGRKEVVERLIKARHEANQPDEEIEWVNRLIEIVIWS